MNQTTQQIIESTVQRASREAALSVYRETDPNNVDNWQEVDALEAFLAPLILRACVELMEQGGVEGAMQNLSGYRRVSNSGIGPGLVPQDHDDIQAALQFYAALRSAAGETKKEGV